MTAIDLRRAAEAALSPEPTVAASAPVPRQYDVHVRYADPATGTVREATVTSSILTLDQSLAVGRLTAALAGAPWETLATHTRLRVAAIALVTIQFGLADAPEWLTRAVGEDDALLAALHEEASAHTERYFRGDADEGDRAPRGPRVSVSAARPAGAAPEPPRSNPRRSE